MSDTPHTDRHAGWNGSQMNVPVYFARSLERELAAAQKENDTLRGLLGNSAKDCIYCGLPATEQARCPSGFPGCSRSDDQMLSQHFADGYRADEAEKELAAAQDDRARAMRLAFELTQDCQTAEESVSALVDLVKLARTQRDAANTRVAELERLLTVDADELARRRQYMGTTLQEVFDRAENAERDALMRAAEVCERRRQFYLASDGDAPLTAEAAESAISVGHCRDAILALLPKEKVGYEPCALPNVLCGYPNCDCKPKERT